MHVPDRSTGTLNAVVSRYVSTNSVFVTDMWQGYSCLRDIEYEQFTVNHVENYVDPTMESHTQEIEGAWSTVNQIYR